MSMLPENWSELSPDEKMAARLDLWVSGACVEFVSPEAEAQYKERATLLRDAFELKKAPARVPVLPHAQAFVVYNAGLPASVIMYEHEKAAQAFLRYHLEFQPDAAPIFLLMPGETLEAIDFKLIRWPGYNLPDKVMYQVVEGEYMKADEYPEFMADTSGFMMRKFLPRVAGALEPLRNMPPRLSDEKKKEAGSKSPGGDPGKMLASPVARVVLKALLSAGKGAVPLFPAFVVNGIAQRFSIPPDRELLKTGLAVVRGLVDYLPVSAKIPAMVAAAGFPPFVVKVTMAPFDALGDYLRGTHGVLTDMYRRPDEVIAACEKLVPAMIKLATGEPAPGGSPFVFIPLHKGSDRFMSEAQYEKFYWPTLKKLMLGLVEEGLIPALFAEGSYNNRLEIIADFPKAKCVWTFDQTEMSRAKEVLGGVACIAGNVSLSMLATGSPDDVKAYCKDLIDACAKGGGFILGTGAAIDECRAENMRAMIDFTKEYGGYD